MDATQLFQSPDEAQKAAETEERGRQALRDKSQEWAEQHKARARTIERELLSGNPDAGPSEVLLFRVTAAEAALAERLSYLQVQVLERVVLLIDSPTQAARLAVVAKDAIAVSGSVGRRIESLLSTAAVLRAQRLLSPSRKDRGSHLRVA